MQDISDRVASELAADGALAALLVGGVYTDYDQATDKSPANPEETPSAYVKHPTAGVPQLQPFCHVTELTSTPFDSSPTQDQTFLRIGFYQAKGYDTIRQAQARARVVLDTKHFETDGGLGFTIHYLDSPFRSSRDPSLVVGEGNREASFEMLRFYTVSDQPQEG